MEIKTQLPYAKVWSESSFDFEDKDRLYPEQFIIAVEHNDGSTESIDSTPSPMIAEFKLDIYRNRLN